LKREKTFTVTIKVPTISSSHRDSNREETRSVFHHFCPGLPVSLTLHNAVRCPRWFLSMGSWRLHNMQ